MRPLAGLMYVLFLVEMLSLSAWGHAIIHATNLILLRFTAIHNLSPLQFANGYQPNILHLRVLVALLGPQGHLGTYVSFQSASIIYYIKPLTGDVFTTRFANYHFDENLFPSLGGDKPIPEE